MDNDDREALSGILRRLGSPDPSEPEWKSEERKHLEVALRAHPKWDERRLLFEQAACHMDERTPEEREEQERLDRLIRHRRDELLDALDAAEAAEPCCPCHGSPCYCECHLPVE